MGQKEWKKSGVRVPFTSLLLSCCSRMSFVLLQHHSQSLRGSPRFPGTRCNSARTPRNFLQPGAVLTGCRASLDLDRAGPASGACRGGELASPGQQRPGALQTLPSRASAPAAGSRSCQQVSRQGQLLQGQTGLTRLPAGVSGVGELGPRQVEASGGASAVTGWGHTSASA